MGLKYINPFLRSTEYCEVFCSTCSRTTRHTVSDGRRGRCLEHDAPKFSKAQLRRRELQEREPPGAATFPMTRTVGETEGRPRLANVHGHSSLTGEAAATFVRRTGAKPTVPVIRKAAPEFTHVWRWRQSQMHPFDRFGQRCRILCCGKMNSATVEFEDGFQVVTSRYAVRKAR
jgi:hypothetical protein